MMYDDDEPAVVLSAGPAFSRHAEDDDPPYVAPLIPLGFIAGTLRPVGGDERGVTRPLGRPEPEPLLWDGDQA